MPALVVEIHRHVVVHPEEVVDTGDVVAPSLEPEAGPIERLGSDDLWNVAARFDVAHSPGAARGIQLDNLWLHVSRVNVGTALRLPHRESYSETNEEFRASVLLTCRAAA